ncbi:glycoside hydrolase family 15 protein [Mycobacterium xenopi]|uniref:Glycoside hydrolase n=1 Tax=Mycobacterium xenopi TaxID=1789 RepID=A0AAD1H2Q3_MYCXE|nr:glycoside hydrolase family 15 protein [Mycobacterium xenopi]MDA3639821.1 glycoside hydrolase family 15 protein [Mycobacterium xenopi]MDA3658181.1 glycoside hydrolase family 15 protein [Mycobacterium xenopi]MDA3661833.1 glycoside hydrolase family 15 protein [Mycobacterium xenopi]ORX21447.1 glycoside hydrolase [Mycobacterium xenopi]SPX88915.1 glycosyl hydrolase [Mycobacterium xenopi]
MQGKPVLAEELAPHVLREYALLADGERGVVVGPRGDCCWMCLPRWDSPAVLCSLLGGRGVYAVSPDHPRFVWGGRYEQRSLIWRSRWVTTDGIVECREALAFPGDPHTAVLLRRIVALDAPMRMRVTLDLRADFGVEPMRDLCDSDGVWTGRTGRHRFRWTGPGEAHRGDDGALHAVMNVAPGHDFDLVLEVSDQELPTTAVRPNDAWRETEQAWANAVPAFSGTLADLDTQTAYAVLRGLTSGGGGMVAAATMSLPERAEQGRNYDYRYCWIRDQCYAGQAVAAAGSYPLLDDAVRFVSERVLADGPRLRPAYSVIGQPPPREQPLDLPGYPGADVKTGNWVTEQFQLDTFGEALLLLAAAARCDRLDSPHWRAAETLVRSIGERWREPDAGIWEIDNRRWAHSRLICAAGLRRIAEQAPARQGAEWQRLADLLVTDADSDCLHPSGRWQRAPDDPRIDAALLMPSIRGPIPTGDPRAVATLEAVRADLGRDGFVYRFQPDQRPLGQAEGAFLLCGFLMALADHQHGNHVAAARWFERNRTACGPPGLLTEEFDVAQRQLRGNLPQAFVHALLFETAHRLADGCRPPVGVGTG